jgi:hypothetical protein
MNTCSHNKPFGNRNFGSALLFALAVLLLVVSCPVKRFLNLNYTSSTQQSSKQENQSGKTAIYNITSCCSLKQKIILVKGSFKKQYAPAHEIVLTSNRQYGFDINYFLSRIRSNHLRSAHTTLFSPPLFLQHRRLLI